ncbi:unnamed protein product [Prorocentrum cordatum]|uniref:Uncharacterized protein n=1 Tax=Prorocentrum cordatum TaxID=2364126 RepID=A0ABN9QSS8_9DINO|nr:unnamed protein product [Polarella glacialis]
MLLPWRAWRSRTKKSMDARGPRAFGCLSWQAPCGRAPDALPAPPATAGARRHHGQAHQEGRHHRQVRHALRSLAEEDRQEVRDPAAHEVHVQLLRQGERQASCRGDLEVQVEAVPKDNRRRMLGHLHHGCGDNPRHDQPLEEGDGLWRRQVSAEQGADQSGARREVPRRQARAARRRTAEEGQRGEEGGTEVERSCIA